MTGPQETAQQALAQAQAALRRGDRRLARRLAQKAASLAPDLEEPWLILAGLSSPQASIRHLQRALAINPNSQRARQGMHWAVQRMRAGPNAGATQPVRTYPSVGDTQPIRVAPVRQPVVRYPVSPRALVRPRPAGLAWASLALSVLMVAGFLWFGAPAFQLALSLVPGDSRPLAIARQVEKATDTPTPTPTFTPTPTATFTPSPTPTFTPSPTPTFTPSPTATFTPEPTQVKAKKPKRKQQQQAQRPGMVADGERWIDVDLSDQRTYAYEGDQLVNSFLVSTGTWLHPTVQGQFRIYVKYRRADMSGPGYYLPNVPYVMYFYKGYGLHGTYWHHNFGTPMSHGCVNLKTDEAGWLFSWASVGTVVNVHQ